MVQTRCEICNTEYDPGPEHKIECPRCDGKTTSEVIKEENKINRKFHIIIILLTGVSLGLNIVWKYWGFWRR